MTAEASAWFPPGKLAEFVFRGVQHSLVTFLAVFSPLNNSGSPCLR